MPNWCSTNIVISGGCPDIADLNYYLETWCSKPYKENGFDTVEMKESQIKKIVAFRQKLNEKIEAYLK